MTTRQNDILRAPGTTLPGAALFGTGVWFLSLALSWTEIYPLTIIEQLFLLAPLIVLPLRAGADRAARLRQQAALAVSCRARLATLGLVACRSGVLPAAGGGGWLAGVGVDADPRRCWAWRGSLSCGGSFASHKWLASRQGCCICRWAASGC